MRFKLGGDKVIELAEGDITTERTEAIVNAANSSLMGGSGVDGAIRSAGGPEIDEACREIRLTSGPLSTGEAVATTAGRLAARHVIHTVGPIYRGGDQGEPELLARAHRSALHVADELGLSSIAFPAISAGIYGYPIAEAARVALQTIAEALPECEKVRLVRFILFGREAFDAYARAAVATLGEPAG